MVGAGAGKDTDVFGDTPNIAARVQAAADPGTVADNRRYASAGLGTVRGRRSRSAGAQGHRTAGPALPGSPAKRSTRASRSGAAARGLTAFVGREDELRLLMNRWERALDGEGQVALIVGEAGIGKSRLVQRFREQIAGTPHTWVEAAAGAFFQNTPFYAVTEMLREFLAWRATSQRKSSSRNSGPRLSAGRTQACRSTAADCAALESADTDRSIRRHRFQPEQQRRRLLATLVEWSLGAARVQPTMIAIEDLHWADPSTLELLQLLVEQGATARLLLLYTARPEFHAPWPPRAHHTQITLNRLSSRNVRTMMGEVAAPKGIVGRDHRDGSRAHQRGAAFCRGADAGGARKWRCEAHRARDSGRLCMTR